MYEIIKSNTQLHIGQHKESKDSVIINGSVIFTGDEQNMLRYLKTKRGLLYELEIVFALANIDFSLKPNVTTDEFTIEDTQLSKTIYYDALTKQSFFDALLSIFNCVKLIRERFKLLGLGSTTT